MANGLCLLNHTLTEQQLLELREKMVVQKILYPYEDLQAKWALIPTDEVLPIAYYSEFIHWIDESSHEGDYIILQGEFGSTFYLVEYVFNRGLIPLHSVTQRVAEEFRQNEVITRTYRFKHVCFRRYVQCRC